MHVGIIGLGRMGNGVAMRLLEGKHEVVVHNRSHDKIDFIKSQGAKGAYTLEELIAALPTPRVVWLYLPSGEVTEDYFQQLMKLLEVGDILIDGGNSHFKRSVQRAVECSSKGIQFVDVGTSGGIAGRAAGYCLMIGGEKEVVEGLNPLFEAVAQPKGYQYVGPAGSGHYVKMVHNAIEYGMMQAYGEGMELLATSQFADQLDLAAVTAVWQQGSIIRSYLGELLHQAMQEDVNLQEIGTRIDDNGEGRWAIEEALINQVSTPVMAASLFVRYQSRRDNSFAFKVVAALRQKFGGHAVYKSKN